MSQSPRMEDLSVDAALAAASRLLVAAKAA
jgi:hypothetical protein